MPAFLRSALLPLAAAAVLAAATYAHADAGYRYELVAPATTGQPGAVLNVDIFLIERIGGNDVSLFLTQNGLASAGVHLQQLPTNPAPTQPAALITIQGNPQFGPPIIADATLSAADLLLMVDASATSGIAPVVDGPDLRVLLGTAQVQLGNTPGEATSFRALDLTFGIDDNITFGDNGIGGTVIDMFIRPSETLTFTVQIVPEPATLPLLLLTAATLLRRRR